ncbi:MAG: hypothetical protein AAGG38_10635 [Planctomycetota bacterium]
MKQRRQAPAVFGSVSRRAYWIGNGVLTAALAALSWWAGFYHVVVPEEHADERVTSNDPISEVLYSELGTAVVLLVFQFLLANVLFWIGAWVRLKWRGRGEAWAES